MHTNNNKDDDDDGDDDDDKALRMRGVVRAFTRFLTLVFNPTNPHYQK